MIDSLSGAAVAPIAWTDADRQQAFGRWFDELAPRHGLDRSTLHLASADASSRRYFRVTGAGGATFIVMDSPAAEDSVAAFVHIGGLILGAGLHAPRVLE
ncbi:MAG TPA: aminoglycoside phosphotransferase, partial [Burkholderiaceae bacterium]